MVAGSSIMAQSIWPSFWLGYLSGLYTGIGLTLIVLTVIVLR
jgi:hypothetical protein